MALPYRLWSFCLTAKRLELPLEFASVGVGKYNTRLGQLFGARTAKLATTRSFRDEQSKQRARDWLGVDVSRDVVTSDMAFALPRDPAWECDPARDRVETVGIGVQNYRHRRGPVPSRLEDLYPIYLEKLTQFSVTLLDRGLRLRLLTGEVSDREAVEDMRVRLAAARPDHVGAVVCNPINDQHDLCDEIGRCDAVIATRFHNVVASLTVGRPTVSLEYAPKNEQLMTEFGLGAYCQSIEKGFSVERLIEHFDSVTAHTPSMRQRLIARAAKLRHEASAHLDGVAARVRAATAPKS